MERLVLSARVIWEDTRYVARVENLPVAGEGESALEAQDELINAMRAWIETNDAASRLERVLAEAGFPGVEEDTEIQLEFVE